MQTPDAWSLSSSATVNTSTTSGICRAMYSPDGRRMVTASADNKARVWEAESGRPISLLPGLDAVDLGVTHSPLGANSLAALLIIQMVL